MGFLKTQEVKQVRAVEVQEGYTLLLTFTNGEQRILDGTVMFENPVLAPLRDRELFKQVRIVSTGALEWPGGLDVDPECLYDESIPAPTIGDRIAERRRAAGKTQQQLADEFAALASLNPDAARAMIAKWETGKSMPSVMNIDPLCLALECSIGWLITGRAS